LISSLVTEGTTVACVGVGRVEIIVVSPFRNGGRSGRKRLSA
jgi:hypothetical protein